MSKQDILKKLKKAMFDLEDEEVPKLLKDGIRAGVSPMEMIIDGMQPALTEIGEMFAKQERFMSDMVIASEIMNDAMAILRPEMEKGGKGKGEVMVIGTVEGDQHNIGKRIVSALFTAEGYKVIDVGENQPASSFVKAAKENKASLVGASVILGPLKPRCKEVSDGLKAAGLRDKTLFIVGGWGMTQEWCDKVEADAFGMNGVEAVHKVKALKAGEMKKAKDRLGK